MNIFFDTSVLVSASLQEHVHYQRTRPALRRVAEGHDNGFMSTHSIAEIYTSLTRSSVRPRVYPDEAANIINENILPHFKTVNATEEDYRQALNHVSQNGWHGAKIYDALLLVIAAKCGVERIYTLDRDFKHIAPTDLQDKICTP